MAANSRNVLGIRIDALSVAETLKIASGWFGQTKLHLIATPNAEIVMQTRSDKSLAEIINNSDLSVADGVGVVWAANLGNKAAKVTKVNGSDLVLSLIELCAKEGKQVYFLASSQGLEPNSAQIAVAKIKKKYPELAISGANVDPDSYSPSDLVVKANFLVVCFGTPVQEKWIESNKNMLAEVSIVVGAGATIDFIAGAQKRAPKTWQKLGFEWFWRLINNPKRIVRQLKLPVFVVLVLFSKIVNKK